MVDCLRKKSIDEILRVEVMSPQHLTAFGPIVDGIVVPFEPRIMMQHEHSLTFNEGIGNFHLNSQQPPISLTPSSWAMNYDVLFGVTRVESPFIFSSHEEKHGIDLSKRDKILRTLVRNLFDYHQQVRIVFFESIFNFEKFNFPV